MIKCLQAKEWLDVPNKILNIVKSDLREEYSIPIKKKKKKKKKSKAKKKKKKKSRLSSYYNNVQQIYNRITGAPPIYLSREREEQII